MSALPIAIPSTPVQNWFIRHLPEIESRSRACFCHLRPEQRDEALAEVFGVVYKTCVNAQKRGVLAKITPYFAVVYAVRQYRAGRRMGGTSSTDVMAETAQVKGRAKVVSLNSIVECDSQTGRPMPLSEVLADRRQDNSPLENVRKNHDYHVILRKERVSRQARTVFRLLAEVRGQGACQVIAHELKVSPGRISHIKSELAEALERNDYGPPATRVAKAAK